MRSDVCRRLVNFGALHAAVRWVRNEPLLLGVDDKIQLLERDLTEQVGRFFIQLERAAEARSPEDFQPNWSKLSDRLWPIRGLQGDGTQETQPEPIDEAALEAEHGCAAIDQGIHLQAPQFAGMRGKVASRVVVEMRGFDRNNDSAHAGS